MGPFPSLFNHKYILLAVDYVSKWVEAMSTLTNDAKVVANFLYSHIFTHLGTPRALIIGGGTHFCNRVVDSVLRKYGVRHHTSLAYHLQTNEQVEVSNRKIKFILEKTMNSSKNDWARKIDDALKAYRTAFKTPLGMFPSDWFIGRLVTYPWS